MQDHGATLQPRPRRIHVANLDPAAEHFAYDVAFDVRDLILVEEVMEELSLGPNGALIYCMEYLLEHLNWLKDHLDDYQDDEYLILDCPGQLELYTHVPIMRRILDRMRMWGYESSMVSVFCVDATFMGDTFKFISGSLLSLSAMIALEMPHVNVLTKCDLMDPEAVESMLSVESATQLWDMEEDRLAVMNDIALAEQGGDEQQDAARRRLIAQRRRKRHKLTEAICSILDDYTMVSFIPLNLNDEDSVAHVLATIDHTIQYGEDLEVRGAEGDDNFGQEY